jgi:hypothetical protein
MVSELLFDHVPLHSHFIHHGYAYTRHTYTFRDAYTVSELQYPGTKR